MKMVRNRCQTTYLPIAPVTGNHDLTLDHPEKAPAGNPHSQLTLQPNGHFILLDGPTLLELHQRLHALDKHFGLAKIEVGQVAFEHVEQQSVHAIQVAVPPNGPRFGAQHSEPFEEGGVHFLVEVALLEQTGVLDQEVTAHLSVHVVVVEHVRLLQLVGLNALDEVNVLAGQLGYDGLHRNGELIGQRDGLLRVLAHWIALGEHGSQEDVITFVEQIGPVARDVIIVLLDEMVDAVDHVRVVVLDGEAQLRYGLGHIAGGQAAEGKALQQVAVALAVHEHWIGYLGVVHVGRTILVQVLDEYLLTEVDHFVGFCVESGQNACLRLPERNKQIQGKVRKI